MSEHFGFSELVVLAKVARCEFHQEVRPGQQLIYRTQIESINNGGAIVSGTSTVDGEVQANVDLVFARLHEGNQTTGDARLFHPEQLRHWLDLVGVFDLGTRQDGTPLRAQDYDLDTALQVTDK